MYEILLADVTYGQLGDFDASPSIVPMAIGGIATYAMENSQYDLNIQLARTIKQFEDVIASKKFDVVGMSYFSWNARLVNLLAQKLKDVQPDCPIILGGPNIPIDVELQEKFVRDHPYFDLLVEKEGEVAFTTCVDAIIAKDFDLSAVKSMMLPSVRSILDGEFLRSPLGPRLKDLELIPSPYLNGMMDEFLEAGFVPILETNRGCPFSCEFCGEGEDYHSKVVRKTGDKVRREVEYLGAKMQQLAHLKYSNYLYFSDSNAGMYKQDLEVGDYIGAVQEKYNWPSNIIASAGKNQKERTIKFSRKLNGAMSMSASVQSTDPEVLKVSKRDNVSIEVLKDLARSNDHDHDTFSEIILGLPGDTYQKHTKSIQDMMDCRITQISTLQLMLLPDTPMLSPRYIERHGLEKRYRLLVKGRDQIEIGGENKTAVEIEAICVGNPNMSFEDYLACREVGFYTTIFYNKIFTDESFDWLEANGLSPFNYVQAVMDLERPPVLDEIVNDFRKDLEKELFVNKEDLVALIEKPGSFELLERGELGFNPLQRHVGRTTELTKILTDMALAGARAVGGDEFAEILHRDIQQNANWKYGSGLVNQRLNAKILGDSSMFTGAYAR